MDPELIIKHLDKSFIYDSQWVIEKQDYQRYIRYIRHKFTTISDSGDIPSVEIVENNILRLQQNEKPPIFYSIEIKDGKVIRAHLFSNNKNLHIAIDYKNPPELFLKARAFAGNLLSEQMENTQDDGKSISDYRWLKTAYTYPFFEHFTFAYKNQVFCVLVDLIINEIHSLDEKAIDCLLTISKSNNLIPCIFPVVINSIDSNTLSNEICMTPVFKGWNLIHAETKQIINPKQIGNDSLTPMSDWEMLDFAIKVVIDQIEKEGGRIESHSNMPKVFPNIWFIDKTGKRSWVIVERLSFKDPRVPAREWSGKLNYEPLSQAKGFHAAVDFQSSAPILYDTKGNIVPLSKRDDESCPRYRGDGMYVNFCGLVEINTVED